MAARQYLANGSARKAIPPFPSQQMLVLAMCRICEPIAFMSIFPYIYFMIEDFGIAENATQISFYAGLVTSAFTLAEFSTGMLWGRLSDKIGRKPVLLTGLAGTGLSVLLFGFAPNLWVALLARALGGFLNGNIGVLQSTVAELVTVKEHQPRAYTIMPLVWCIGSIVGPLMGGILARPCRNYPAFFSPDTIWARFPYLLPNLVSAAAVFFGLTVGILFLEETHIDRRHRRDPGLELGKRILALFARKEKSAKDSDSETDSLLSHDDLLPKYRTVENSPRLDAQTMSELETQSTLDIKPVSVPEPVTRRPRTPPATQSAFTKPVIMNIMSYGILAFHTMTFDQLFPIYLSGKPSANPPPQSLPFKFVGGFHLEQTDIAVILAAQGVYQLFATTTFCPYVIRRVGALRLFQILATSYFILYLLTPYLALLPEYSPRTGLNLQLIGIYAAVVWRCTFSAMLFPTNAILLTNSAPSPRSLGVINGAAASTASLCRAFSPTLSGFLFAMGLSSGFSALAWWFNAFAACVGAFIALRVTEPRGRMDDDYEVDVEDEKDDEEAALRTGDESVVVVVLPRPSMDV